MITAVRPVEKASLLAHQTRRNALTARKVDFRTQTLRKHIIAMRRCAGGGNIQRIDHLQSARPVKWVNFRICPSQKPIPAQSAQSAGTRMKRTEFSLQNADLVLVVTSNGTQLEWANRIVGRVKRAIFLYVWGGIGQEGIWKQT
jgi:hypothetical protein